MRLREYGGTRREGEITFKEDDNEEDKLQTECGVNVREVDD